MLRSIKMHQDLTLDDHSSERAAEKLWFDRYRVVATNYGSHMVVDFATPDPKYGVCGGWRLICETRSQALAEKIARS